MKKIILGYGKTGKSFEKYLKKNSVKYLIYDPSKKYNLSLHCPEYIEPSQNIDELEIIERIFISFKKMKENQK